MIKPTSKPDVNKMAIKVNVLTGVTPTHFTLPHFTKIATIASRVKIMPALSHKVIIPSPK
jgi:hypothetical protein